MRTDLKLLVYSSKENGYYWQEQYGEWRMSQIFKDKWVAAHTLTDNPEKIIWEK